MKKCLMMIGLLIFMLGQSRVSRAQGTSVQELPKGWHLLDKEKDGFYGISLEKAYEFVKGKKSNTIIVAVIDSGIDTLHEDLKEVLWTNPKEIPNNNIDDDKNGYIDDIHGWNFIGGKDGTNVKEDSYEGARMYHKLKKIFEEKTTDTSSLSPELKEQHSVWLKVKSSIEGDASDGGIDVMIMQKALESSLKGDSILRKSIGQEVYTGNDLDKYAPVNADEQRAKAAVLFLFKANNMMETTNKEFLEGLREYVGGQQKKKESLSKAPGLPGRDS